MTQSLVAYWFTLPYGAQPALLGILSFVANILAGLSSLVAARLAVHIGLIRTMVFTHMPGNVLLIALPLMPNLPGARVPKSAAPAPLIATPLIGMVGGRRYGSYGACGAMVAHPRT